MAFRSAVRAPARLRTVVKAPYQRYASAIAVPTSTASEQKHNDIKREARLPNPDPPADSASAQMTKGHEPYMVTTYARPPPVIVQGEGCRVFDIENRQYLDFMAGIAVNALGHAEPEISKILYQQSRTLMHASNLYYNAWSGELSKRLVETTKALGGMKMAARAFLCNSGSEANEAAIKFARKVGRIRDPSGAKHEIVSFHGSFHGRTLGALSATPNSKYQTPFSPMVPGFRYATLNDEANIDSYITEKTCGVLIEPIQGEGGVHEASPAFLQKLRDRCTAMGAVLIYDEIQCGLSRTGDFWAHSSLPASAHPDILTTAKALGNGFPVGAVLVSEDVAACMRVGDHGTTFGGNPLAARIAHYIVGRLAEPELREGVRTKEQIFRQGFDGLRERFPQHLGETRGRGLILGLQMHADPTPVVTAARERGLLIITAGTNTLRFVPPLVISEAEIREGLGILEEAMSAVFETGEDVKGTKGQQEMPLEGR